MNPQDEYGFEVFDLDLSIVFMKFSLDNVLKVILAILTECKILFTSKNYGLLTPFVQVKTFILLVNINHHEINHTNNNF